MDVPEHVHRRLQHHYSRLSLEEGGNPLTNLCPEFSEERHNRRKKMRTGCEGRGRFELLLAGKASLYIPRPSHLSLGVPERDSFKADKIRVELSGKL